MINSHPAVSVIMPVYNAERYVGTAIKSILNQSFTDFEYLIVNDRSSDRSLQILEQYAQRDRRIRLIYPDTPGYAAALNTMLQEANGELIARMDADDIACPQRLALQVEFLRKHPKVVCVGGSHYLIDQDGRLLTYLELPTDHQSIEEKALAGHGSICHPSVMMRASALNAIGGYNPDLVPAEDLDLWLRLGEVGELANLNEPLLKYRLHLQSVSETKGQLQRQKAEEACQRAWQRRGIEGTFEADYAWRPTNDRASKHRFMLQYGWWAFNSGQRQTAMLYGGRAVRIDPWRKEGWVLLGCAIAKPFPKNRPILP